MKQKIFVAIGLTINCLLGVYILFTAPTLMVIVDRAVRAAQKIPLESVEKVEELISFATRGSDLVFKTSLVVLFLNTILFSVLLCKSRKASAA